MTKFEYTKIPLTMDYISDWQMQQINNMGKHGWELITIWNNTMIFKKEIYEAKI